MIYRGGGGRGAKEAASLLLLFLTLVSLEIAMETSLRRSGGRGELWRWRPEEEAAICRGGKGRGAKEAASGGGSDLQWKHNNRGGATTTTICSEAGILRINNVLTR